MGIRQNTYTVTDLKKSLGIVIPHGAKQLRDLRKASTALFQKHFEQEVERKGKLSISERESDYKELLESYGPTVWPVPVPSQPRDRIWLRQVCRPERPSEHLDMIYQEHRAE